MCPAGAAPIISLRMDGGGMLHRIEDDLSASWLEEWVERGVTSIEAYLAKHLAFLTYLDDTAQA
jgi:hypothetical protein